MLGLETLKSLALRAVAWNQHIERTVDRGPGPAEPLVRLSALLWQPCSCAFVLGNLRVWCHYLSRPYSPFWNSSVHDQLKLVSIDAFHHSLHAVPEHLLRRCHLEICPFAAQMPSFLKHSVILTAAVICCLLLVVLMQSDAVCLLNSKQKFHNKPVFSK